MRARIIMFCMTRYRNPHISIQSNMQRVRRVIITMIILNRTGRAVPFPTTEEIFALFAFA